MGDLKNSILFLLVYIFTIFGIAQVDFVEKNLINFDSIFFILVALAVFSALVIVPLTFISFYQFLFIWAIVYGVVRVVYWNMAVHHSLELILLEFVLVGISAGLSYDVARQTKHVNRLLDELTTLTYPNRTMDLRSSGDRINAELTRSRRYHRPLSLLVVQLEKGLPKSVRSDDVLERDVLSRFSAARIGHVINEQVRETDLILSDTQNRFILVCPETEFSYSTKLAERIAKTVAETVGRNVEFGSASFPDEALTFEDLVQKAVQRITPVAFEPVTENAENNLIQ